MLDLVFNPAYGVDAPSSDKLRAQVEARFKAIFRERDGDPELDTDPTTPMGQIIDLLVAEIEARNAQIAYLVSQFDIDSARGLFLDAHASHYWIERKVSEPSLVTCELTGDPNTFIPYGVVAKDDEGNAFRHNKVEGVTLDETGRAKTTFQAVKHGALVIKPHTVTKLATVVPGLKSIDNESAGIVGRDSETDSEFLARVRESSAINAQGSVLSLRAALQNLDGVIHAVVLVNDGNQPKQEYGVTLEPHTFGVAITGGNDDDIARTIWAKKDGGSGTSGNTTVTYADTEHHGVRYHYKIFRPSVVKFGVKIIFYAESMDGTTKAAVKQAVLNDFLGLDGKSKRVGFAETVYATRFILAVSQVTNFPIKSIELRINGGEFDKRVIINADQQPTMSLEDVIIETAGG